MVGIAGRCSRSAAVAAIHTQPMPIVARRTVESCASTLATTRATSAKPRVVAARKAYWRGDRSVIAP